MMDIQLKQNVPPLTEAEAFRIAAADFDKDKDYTKFEASYITLNTVRHVLGRYGCAYTYIGQLLLWLDAICQQAARAQVADDAMRVAVATMREQEIEIARLKAMKGGGCVTLPWYEQPTTRDLFAMHAPDWVVAIDENSIGFKDEISNAFAWADEMMVASRRGGEGAGK